MKKIVLRIILILLVLIMIILPIIFYFVEHAVQPKNFSNIIDAVVWIFVQFIGNGGLVSYSPITLVGKK